MKAVMYHYVRGATPELPFFRYLDTADFKRQLDCFEAEGGIANQQDFLDFLEYGKASNKFLLSFDDGLRDHYDHVMPELIRRNAWGMFFVCSAPLDPDSDMLRVHKVHTLLGRFGSDHFYQLVCKRVNDIEALVPSDAYARQQSEWKEKALKYLFNYALPAGRADAVLNDIGADMNLDTRALARDFYLNDDQLTEMADKGMYIAAHSISHPLLSQCEDTESERQILESTARVSKYQRAACPPGFCFPYGGENSYTARQLEQLKKSGVKFNFVVQSATLAESKSVFELARFDCNEFRFGKSTVAAA